MDGFSSGAQFSFITSCNFEQETKQSDQILCIVLLYAPQSHDCVLPAVTFKPLSVYTLSLACIFLVIFRMNSNYFHPLHFVIMEAELC
jgi:hypothetical protein